MKMSRGLRFASCLGLCLLTLISIACDREDLFSGDSLETSRPPPPPPPEEREILVSINEVMVKNTKTLADEGGKFPPWVELYNRDEVEVDLGGIALTNDSSDPEKWLIPSIPEAVVPPKGYLIVFADGDTTNENDLHANFTLAAGPVNLVLNKGSDTLFVNIGLTSPSDISFGRFPDGDPDNIGRLGEPTPGAVNIERGGSTPPPPPPPAQGKFIRGDANADSRLNVLDMTEISAVLFRGEAMPLCQDRLDANDDGKATLADSSYLAAFLFQQGPRLPAPFPTAGEDPTADSLPCPAQ